MPVFSSSAKGVWNASEMSTTPHAAASTATASTHRRDSTAARVSGPDELDRHGHADRQVRQGAVEREVHQARARRRTR